MSFSERVGESEIRGDFDKLEELVKNLGRKFYVDVGVLGENNETEEGGITIAGIAAVHEFGTDRAGRGNTTVIPERSVIRGTLEKRGGAIVKEVDKHFEESLENGDVRQIFVELGLAAEAQIQEAFDTGGFGDWEPLADSTIERKKSDSILIDDGTLRKAYTSRVGEAK